MSRVLIVGKNSKIVKGIRGDLSQFDLISHQEIDALRVSEYDKVFIFSWSHKCLEDNLALLNRFKLDRVVFISTISVLACARRYQWASYPKEKLICENLVLTGGGQVIRIGIWERSFLKYLPGAVPITTPKTLMTAINESLKSNSRILWPIELHSGELYGIKLYLGNILNALSDILPSKRVLQAPIALASKLVGTKDYGYTRDCLKFFSQRVLIGFGALGSAVSRELDLRGLSHTIVVSRDKNIFLNGNGFRGMRLGQYKEGLSKLWHGVWITNNDGDTLRKNVPLFVPRPSVPLRAIYGTVDRIDFGRPVPSVEIKNTEIADVRVFAKAIHLAAGVVNNVRILQATHPISTTFSDHEIGELGVVKTEELVIRRLINRRFGFVYGRSVLRRQHENFDYIIDFRPKAANSIEFDAENIYNNRSDQIIRKLFKSLSLSLVNQAFFNKFGISFDVGLLSVIVQIDVPNCIKLSIDGQLTRSRLSPIILDGIANSISFEFKSFCKTKMPQTFDAIHVHGGFTLDELPVLKEYLENKCLFLHGNVLNGSPLGPFHNTVAMIDREREIIKNV